MWFPGRNPSGSAFALQGAAGAVPLCSSAGSPFLEQRCCLSRSLLAGIEAQGGVESAPTGPKAPTTLPGKEVAARPKPRGWHCGVSNALRFCLVATLPLLTLSPLPASARKSPLPGCPRVPGRCWLGSQPRPDPETPPCSWSRDGAVSIPWGCPILEAQPWPSAQPRRAGRFPDFPQRPRAAAPSCQQHPAVGPPPHLHPHSVICGAHQGPTLEPFPVGMGGEEAAARGLSTAPL